MDDVKEKHTHHISHGVDTQDNNEESMKMEELLGPEIPVEEGKVITVKVVGEEPDGFLVDLGLKTEGLVPRNEFAAAHAPKVTVGSEIPVMVVRLHTESGRPLVSYRRVQEKEAWQRIADAQQSGTPIEGTVAGTVKGGLTVDIGVDAFLPASQVELRFVKDLSQFVGRKLQFLVTEVNREKRNVVLSRRKLLEIDQAKRREEVLARIKEGDLVEGPVTGITNFGAFIDIGGIEGLLHIGDIAWHRIDKVESVLKPGERVKVKVLKIDPQKNKISLGLKQVLPKPWDSAPEKYPAGSTITGKVTSITDFGVFVEVEPGIEGLLHASELYWDGRKENLKKLFTVGQQLEVKILSVDKDKEKMSLSLKRLQENPWEEFARAHTVGSRVQGTVTHLTPFGAFVRLPEGIEGLIHVGDISWGKKIRHPQDALKEGQEVEVTVLGVDPQNEKISLSLKHKEEDPFKKFRTGAVVTGTVQRLADFGAFVELEPGIEALLRTADMGSLAADESKEPLKVGQTIEAKVVKSDPRERKIDISVKRLEHEQERELLKKYVNREERPTLGDVLEESKREENEDED
jgi:small subunit ribosomal protein S1